MCSFSRDEHKILALQAAWLWWQDNWGQRERMQEKSSLSSWGKVSECHCKGETVVRRNIDTPVVFQKKACHKKKRSCQRMILHLPVRVQAEICWFTAVALSSRRRFLDAAATRQCGSSPLWAHSPLCWFMALSLEAFQHDNSISCAGSL